MMPENTLSVVPHPGSFGYPIKSANPDDRRQAWEMGGVALNDPSLGLAYQLWYAWLDIDDLTTTGTVWLEAPNTLPFILFADVGITDIDLAFDQNMHPFIAYQQSGIWKYWWWDPLIVGQIHTLAPVGARGLKCCLDDHNFYGVDGADILLVYINSVNSLCYRQQRDRYGIERVLRTGVAETVIYAARNKESRVQLGIGYYS